jgi:hypothetical protein
MDNLTPPDKFIQFGCWNNLNVSPKGEQMGCLTDVMTALTNYIRADIQRTKFVVVTGDNYYPEKTTTDNIKTKLIYPERLADGFDMLPSTLPTYVLLGNHDLETNDVKKQPLMIKSFNSRGTPEHDPGADVDIPVKERTGSCAIMSMEKSAVSRHPNLRLTLCAHRMLTRGNLLIMLDTSMYDRKDAPKFLPCYNHSNLLPQRMTTVEQLHAYQLEQILGAIRKYKDVLTNIILVGHHPIVGVKSKKVGGESEMYSDIPDFQEVLRTIYRFVNSVARRRPKYYYMCSDLHLYQTGTIHLLGSGTEQETMVIEQYISGIGGTKLDPLPAQMDSEYENDMVRYQPRMVVQDCGFVVCTIVKGMPKFTPIFLQSLGTLGTPGTPGTSVTPLKTKPTKTSMLVPKSRRRRSKSRTKTATTTATTTTKTRKKSK